MSVVPGELRLGESRPTRPPSLSRAAWLVLAATAATTLGLAVPLLVRLDLHTSGWSAFLVLSACAATAQLFVVRTTRDQSYHTSTAFLIAGALLLRPELVVLMGVVQHIPEWLKHRYAWYIQTFNICNFTLDGLAAWGVARLVLGHAPGWAGRGLTAAVAGLAACVIFVLLNHALMAAMLYVARGHHPRETELFGAPMLSTEFVLAAVGIGIAAFWDINAWLIPFTLAPLLLVHRSLHVPRLEEQARVDPKTGLFNARHFAQTLGEELARGERFGRPVSLIMADLDLLRDINNTHGHLVGDEVLAGVADVLRNELRDYDVPARFGGEEFALLLPETDVDHALEIAERLRRAVARRAFTVDGADDPLRVTISMGVASFPDDSRSPHELVHHADVAVYRAKLQGRNRVQRAGPEVALLAEDRLPPLLVEPGSGLAARTERRRRKRHGAVERRRRAAPGSWPGLGRLVPGWRGWSGGGRLDDDLTERVRAQNESLAAANRLLRERSTAAMESLSTTVDARDTHTQGHSRRVWRLALEIGRQLDLSRPELDVLGHAALFHDIGKLVVPESILTKPARLDTEEWRLVRRHPDEGARLVGNLVHLADSVPAIRHHHERFDGSGYPDGLAGEEIPLGARIIHVADAVDSMLTPLTYRGALTKDETLAELRANAGTQFCPRCVQAVERVLESETVAEHGPVHAAV